MSKDLLIRTVMLQVESVLVRTTPLLETNAINVLKIILVSLIAKVSEINVRVLTTFISTLSFELRMCL